ncbi:site-specific DNA recombinase [Vibrio crassostreae]|nr:site-specific DNA recombinase [Vibrio crassostreae]CAK2334862.1 site-specific DNA recombinase [Vibrio crassostreae]CAK2503178.1 site-specific DNA recombinase [Vibrio crassostreae]CAK2912101.1 site-specific DNA recombinase [Vibrio crassostreae]
MNQPTIISYSRVSSATQIAGTGLAQQKDSALLERLSHEYQMPIDVRTFSDEGRSAYKGDHLQGEFGLILELISTGSIAQGSIIAITSLDRLSRAKTNEAMELILSVLNRGIRIYTAMDNKYYSSDSPNLTADLIVSVIIMAQAHEESLKKSERTRGAALSKIQNHNDGIRSEAGYAIPIGLGRVPWWIDTSNGDVRLSDVYAPIARDVIDMYLDGKGLQTILDYLNANYPPPRTNRNSIGKLWNNNSISQIHLQESLTGKYSVKLSGVEYQLIDYMPRLITDDKYWRLIATKKSRAHARSKIGRKYVLTGFNKTKCGFCHGSVTSTIDGERIRLRCVNAAARKAVCRGFSLNSKHIEAAIMDSISPLLIFQESKDYSGEVAAQEANLQHLHAKLAQVEADYEETLSNALARVLSKLEKDISSKEKEVDELKLKAASEQMMVTEIPNDDAGKRAMLSHNFETIMIYHLGGRKVLVALKATHGGCTFIFIDNGKVKQRGTIYEHPHKQHQLFEINYLPLFSKSNEFTQWVDSQYGVIE